MKSNYTIQCNKICLGEALDVDFLAGRPYPRQHVGGWDVHTRGMARVVARIAECLLERHRTPQMYGKFDQGARAATAGKDTREQAPAGPGIDVDTTCWCPFSVITFGPFNVLVVVSL